MLSTRAQVALLLGCCLLAPTVGWADGFEGTLKFRTITVPTDQLKGLTEGGSTDTQKVYAIPMDKLLTAPGVKPRESVIQVRGSKVRANTGGRDPDGYVIMDVDQGTSLMVMPAQKKYVEWSKADMKELTDKMSAMQKQMKERMAGLPPEQRKQMEAMMKNLPDASGNAPQPQVRALGKTQTINGMQTSAYEVRIGDESAIGWVTKDQKDLQHTFKNLREGEEKMMSHNPGKGIQAALADNGLPIRVQKVDKDEYRVEELIDVQRTPMSADLFSVPAGFEKTTPQQMMGHGQPGKPEPKSE
jgi:uncharacterized protein DUF4412